MHTVSGKLGKAGLLRRAGCMAAMMWLALGCARAELEPRTAVEVVVPAHFQRIVDRLSSRFADRPYERYSSEQVLPERRAGYEWLGTWPAGLLATEYPAWAARHGRPNVLKPQTPQSP